jgi:hypothetical protein
MNPEIHATAEDTLDTFMQKLRDYRPRSSADILRQTIDNVNKNIDACGALILLKDGTWVDDVDQKTKNQIKHKLPAVLSEVGKLRGMELSVASITTRFENGLEFEIID